MNTSQVISGAHNPLMKRLRRLQHGKGVKRERQTLVSGSRLVLETLRDRPGRVAAALLSGENMPPPDKLPADAVVHRLSPELFRTVDQFGTRGPVLLVDTPALPRWDPQRGFPSGLTLLVPFQDPENVGAVIRSAVAFGVSAIILLEECAHPFHPKAVRASGGAVLAASLRSGPSLNALPPGLEIIALSGEGEDIGGFTFPESSGLLPGLEGPGVPAMYRKSAVSIPIGPGVESLNAAAAAAIALYLWSRGRA